MIALKPVFYLGGGITNTMENININQSACLQSANNIGGTVIHNVCNGMISYVPWGSADWLGIIFLAVLLIGGAVVMYKTFNN